MEFKRAKTRENMSPEPSDNATGSLVPESVQELSGTLQIPQHSVPVVPDASIRPTEIQSGEQEVPSSQLSYGPLNNGEASLHQQIIETSDIIIIDDPPDVSRNSIQGQSSSGQHPQGFTISNQSLQEDHHNYSPSASSPQTLDELPSPNVPGATVTNILDPTSNDDPSTYTTHMTSATTKDCLRSAISGVPSLSSDDELGDVQKVKPKQTASAPPSDESKHTSSLNSQNDDEEGTLCTICFENWTSHGHHRLVVLRCGHLFGYHCIDRWLRSGHKRCPTCNAAANRKQINPVFAPKKLAVVDTGEIERLRTQLNYEKLARESAERAQAEAMLKIKEYEKEIHALQETQRRVSSSGLNPSLLASGFVRDGSVQGRYVIVTRKKLSNAKNRCLAYDRRHNVLAVSGYSDRITPFFRNGSYGIYKVSGIDFSMDEFLPMHHKEIRDLQACPTGELILSAGIDNSLRIASLVTKSVVQTYRLPAASWACAWNANNPVQLYCGLTNNNILEFDMRNPTQVVDTLTSSSTCPVISLQQYEFDGMTGLLSCHLKGASFWEYSNGAEPVEHLLPDLDGTCTSLSTVGSIGLCSYRPSKACNVTRHVVFSLQTSQSQPHVNLQTVVGSQVHVDRQSDDTANDDDVTEANGSSQTSGRNDQHSQNETAHHTAHGETGSRSTNLRCVVHRQLLGGPQQTKLAKSILLSRPHSNEHFVCASNEAHQSVLLWDASSGEVFQELKRDRAKLPYICFADATPERSGDRLAALADGTLEILEWSSHTKNK